MSSDADKNAVITDLYLEVLALKKSLVEAKESATFWETRSKSLDKAIDTNYISKEYIAAYVARLFERSEIPLPPGYPKGEGITTKVMCNNVQFLSDGIYLEVSFAGCGHGSGCSTFPFYMKGLVPDNKEHYPDFHLGYTKTAPAKRVRKPKAKPASEKKADKS